MADLLEFMQLRQYAPGSPSSDEVNYDAHAFLDFTGYRAPAVAKLLESRKNLAAVALGVALWRRMNATQKAIVIGTAALAAIGRQVIAQNQPNEVERLRIGLFKVIGKPEAERMLENEQFTGFTRIVATLQAGAMTYGRSMEANEAFLRGIALIRLALSDADDEERVAPILTRPLGLPRLDVDGVHDTAELRQLLDDVERVDARVRLGGTGSRTSPQLEVLSMAAWKGKFDGAMERLEAFRQEVGLDVQLTLAHLKTVIQTEMDLARRRGDRASAEAFKDLFQLDQQSLEQLDYASKARVRILGRGDLMKIKTETVRYDLGDIAHVENISARSHRGRKTILESETITTTLTESVEEQLSETVSTESETMDLSRHATKAASTTTSGSVYGEAGASYAGAYVMAGGNYSSTSTTEGSNTSAVNFGKEISKEAVSMARKEVFSSRRNSVRNRSVDEVEQSFTNDSGDHARGIYRWLEKVERAQVYNYGERLLLEMIVPEPATQLLQLATPDAGALPVAPPELTITPDMIDEENYHTHAKTYGVSNIEVPPPFEVYASDVIVTDPAVAQHMMVESPEEQVAWAYGVKGKTLEIPEGYAAVTAYVSVSFPVRNDGAQDLDIALGTVRTNIAETDSDGTRIIEISPALEGPLPIGIGIDHKYGAAATFRVLCRRSDTAWRTWQQKVYDQIRFEYDQQMDAYRTALARHQAVADAFEIPASNAAMNRDVEMRELKRACQTLMSRQYFYTFGALSFETGQVSEINGDKIWQDSRFIQFFEDCFEWHLMSYTFYPYQWAGRGRWQDLLARKSDDPLYQAFLQAGAGRVVVSVREGYEHVVGRFLLTGEIPELSLLPWRDSDVQFPPLVELIADANDRPLGEVPVGDPWEFTTPTPYLYLQTSDDVNNATMT